MAMEKYIRTHKEEMDSSFSMGHFFALVEEKHKAAYGIDGANNIFLNVSDIYKQIQNQLKAS